MPSQLDTKRIRDILGYQSLSDFGIIEALTAAGANDKRSEGNKTLAQMGTSLIEYHILEMGYKTSTSRGKVAAIRSVLMTADYRALVAKRQGIDRCITYSPSSQGQAVSVIAQATSALIGILNIESRDPDITREGMLRLGFLSLPESNTDHKDLLSRFRSTNISEPPANGNSPAMPEFNNILLGLHEPCDQPLLWPSHYSENYSTVPAQEAINDDLNSLLEKEGSAPILINTKRSVQALGDIEQPTSKRQETNDYFQRSIVEDVETQEISFNPFIQNRLLGLNEKMREVSLTILVQIASASSVVALKEALECSRVSPRAQSWRISSRATQYERMAIIGELEAREVYCALLKRYHVMDLFKDCGGPSSRRTTNMVMYTGKEMAQMKRPGNPCHNDEASVTDKMMQGLFPCLQVGCKEYESKRRYVSRLRVLGRRLQMFATKFGDSSLAFMQPCKIPGYSEKPISDPMILSLNDAEFKVFLDILEEAQGNMLRQFGSAAEHILRHIIYEDKSHPEPFYLETIDREEVLRHPKGSLGLLQVLR